MNIGERNGTILLPIKKIKIKNNNHFRNRPLTLSPIAYFDAALLNTLKKVASVAMFIALVGL